MIYTRPTPIFVSKNLNPNINVECWKQQELNVKSVQKITKGDGAILGMIDDGVGTNTEIKGVKIDRWTYLDNSVPKSGDHSTFGVTAIVGKKMGIFPEMGIISKQVLNPETGMGRSKEIANAIRILADKGVQTINLSFGSNSPDREIEKALEYYCSNGVNVATIASGNDGPKTKSSDFPANYANKIKGCLSVAATEIDSKGTVKVALFSSRGVVSVAAPGAMLKSMDDKEKIDFIYGTSFSAPIVGAAIAVARTLISRPLYQEEILDILAKTSKKIDTVDNVGNGSINIIEFFNQVKILTNEFTPKNQIKKTPIKRFLELIGL